MENKSTKLIFYRNSELYYTHYLTRLKYEPHDKCQANVHSRSHPLIQAPIDTAVGRIALAYRRF